MRLVPDLIAPNLKILFCGINPGTMTAETGHHFARPGNRFWPALYQSHLIDTPLTPPQGMKLLDYGYGITNMVMRESVRADELTTEEIKAGWQELQQKVLVYQPRVLAICGIQVYRTATGERQAQLGLQKTTIGDTHIWLLPNPSGLNAHYQAKDFARLFSEVKSHVESIS